MGKKEVDNNNGGCHEIYEEGTSENNRN